MAWTRITPATRLWFIRWPSGAPSLSLAVIRGAPRVLSSLWAAQSPLVKLGYGRRPALGGPGRLPSRRNRTIARSRRAHTAASPRRWRIGRDETQAAHKFVSPARDLAYPCRSE